MIENPSVDITPLAAPAMGGAPQTPDETSRLSLLFHWILRFGMLACFVGHGVVGLHTNAAWLPYFAAVGISAKTAFLLMPLVAVMDIAVGILCFWRPTRIVVAWGAGWCVWTAMIRPVAGMSLFEFIERAGNYGVPIAFLLATSAPGTGLRSWFSRLEPRPFSPRLARRLTVVLVATTALLLLGHGGYGAVLVKESLARHYTALGIAGDAVTSVVRSIGAFELLLAAGVVIFPRMNLLIAIAAWKLLTEILHPLSGASVWEVIERGGSYAAPLAAAVLLLVGQARRQSRVGAKEPSS